MGQACLYPAWDYAPFLVHHAFIHLYLIIAGQEHWSRCALPMFRNWPVCSTSFCSATRFVKAKAHGICLTHNQVSLILRSLQRRHDTDSAWSFGMQRNIFPFQSLHLPLLGCFVEAFLSCLPESLRASLPLAMTIPLKKSWSSAHCWNQVHKD